MLLRIVPLLAVGLLVTGCGRQVFVAPGDVSEPAIAQACTSLVADLPAEIPAGRSWDVEPDPASTKAWGTPTVVLRCSADAVAPAPTDQVVQVDGISWLVTTLTDGEEYVTVGRTPQVSVRIPRDYAPTAAMLTEFTSAVTGNTEEIIN